MFDLCVTTLSFGHFTGNKTVLFLFCFCLRVFSSFLPYSTKKFLENREKQIGQNLINL